MEKGHWSVVSADGLVLGKFWLVTRRHVIALLRCREVRFGGLMGITGPMRLPGLRPVSLVLSEVFHLTVIQLMLYLHNCKTLNI